ncbi:MAG TPA: protoporphyrinogen oxidase [Longimicrobiales bacterium]
MTDFDCDVLVVGAGISGLTAAFRLNECGFRVIVIEAAAHTGGVIRTVRDGDALYERGPNSILETSPHIAELIDRLGIRAQRIDTNPVSARRFVVREGRLVALPTSLRAFVRTPLFSTRAKLRLLREPFMPRAPLEPEESVADFVVRRLGPEFLDYAVEPFVAGIYAGDPRQLSVAAAFPKLHALEQRYGSLIRGQILGARERGRKSEKARTVAKSFSFLHGLQTLTDALATHAGTVRTDTRAIGLRRASQPGIVATIQQQHATSELVARAVMLAVPADETARLVQPFAPASASALSAIPYAPVASVASVYRRSDVAHPLDGFGFLAPRVEQRRILGTLFSSSMFDGRAAPDKVLLTTFVGGQRNPSLPLLPEADVLQLVNEELEELLGARNPASVTVTRWPRAIPQYTIGHLERVQGAMKVENAVPGLYLCASWRGGVAVGDCIASGWAMAATIKTFLGSLRSGP